MNFKIICMMLPFLGAFWGACAGAYFGSNNKTQGKKLALWISGILNLLFIIFIMIWAFDK